jgi:hypothetical protein
MTSYDPKAVKDGEMLEAATKHLTMTILKHWLEYEIGPEDDSGKPQPDKLARSAAEVVLAELFILKAQEEGVL